LLYEKAFRAVLNLPTTLSKSNQHGEQKLRRPSNKRIVNGRRCDRRALVHVERITGTATAACSLLVGDDGITLEEFLLEPVARWVERGV